MISNYENVKIFTEECRGIKCPEIPQKMSLERVVHLIQMMLSEIVELAETVTDSPKDALQLVTNCLGCDLHEKKKVMNSDRQIICEQGDALIDMWYYALNESAKHGIDLSKIFEVVHDANMKKRDPETGKFILRDGDKKIIKPVGWQEPDIEAALFG
jgi:predicted HAD superfamily Cof-like phosphohydrolase